MKKNLINKNNILLLIIILFGAILRLYNLNWDNGYFLHPDERLYINNSNISIPKTLEEFLSPDSSLNPNMFYYGPLPLYLYKISNSYIFTSMSLLITSRLVSALFSIFTIPLIFLIGRKIFSEKVGLLSALIFTLSIESIQYAHFNTTESILVFLLSLILFLSIKVVKENNFFYFIPLGILLGFSYAAKITGLVFVIMPSLSFLILFFSKENLKKIFFWGFIFLILTAITGVILAPYQIFDLSHFLREQEYMQGVTYGKYKPPFTIIYEGSIPYLFPLIQILPFTFGFLAFPLSLIGLIIIIKKYINQKNIYLLFLIIFPLLYFSWAGNWYAKYARYYILLFPFLAIWAGVALSKLKNIYLLLLIPLLIINALFFFRIYMFPNTRVTASHWIYQNISSNKIIASEHWDDPLPLSRSDNDQVKTFTSIQLAVYDPDSKEKIEKLAIDLSISDYFIISSRRVYFSIFQNPQTYPQTIHFYQLLFNGKLGFEKIKEFSFYPFFVSDNFADETFQSYDHPPVLIFQNNKKFSPEQIINLISKTN
ncbi:MAG: glycosyltransferase family 39 protein [Candidatus Daviesbacteria bacterium]|nr:glycosyltransferase family 39 protein [Candidatus Daviesbacteria bacterium]